MTHRNVVIGLILLLLVIGGLSLSQDTTYWLRERAMSVMSIPIGWIDSLRQLSSEVDTSLQTLKSAQEEAGRLRVENTKLELEKSILNKLSEENSRLREMLNFKESSPLNLLPARVVSRDPSSWWSTVQINHGWANDPNIKPDMPVVTPRGIVGKTGVVSRNLSQVILLADENCKIAARIDGSSAHGIVVGEGQSDLGKPLVRMKYIDPNAEIGPGQVVLTSGLGDVFPADLVIGTILRVEEPQSGRAYGQYREAVIEPNVDLNHLTELFVVQGMQPAAVTEGKTASAAPEPAASKSR
jgi:rod shape-determining protein MreC